VPNDFSFTFSTIKTPGMRPRPSWLLLWILGIAVCEGLREFLWADKSLHLVLPAAIAQVPRSLAAAIAIGVWQSFLLFRWLKGGGDWWLPTLVGLALGDFLAARVVFTWTVGGWVVPQWLPAAALAGLAAALGQWLVLRQTLRRSYLWLLAVPCARMLRAALVIWGGGISAGWVAAMAAPNRVVAARLLVVAAATLTDGWLLGWILYGLLGPGDRRGPQLRLSR
jgi:hypothetical protein